MISILLLSWNRLDKLKTTLSKNLDNCGTKFELLVADQGSDKEVINYINYHCPTYFRQNARNEGINKSANQLYLRAKGDYIALMSNDIIWPEGWGKSTVEWINKIPNAGLCGIDWGHDNCKPLSKRFGYEAHFLEYKSDKIFGPTIFNRRIVETVGLFSEDFGPYGLEDTCLNDRVNRAGFNSFYLPHLKAEHIGADVGENSEYRKMKDVSLDKNYYIFQKKYAEREAGGSIIEPLPDCKDHLL